MWRPPRLSLLLAVVVITACGDADFMTPQATSQTLAAPTARAGARGRPEKMTLCHERPTGFAKVNVPLPAAKGHLAHGDGEPWGNGPASLTIFGAECGHRRRALRGHLRTEPGSLFG